MRSSACTYLSSPGLSSPPPPPPLLATVGHTLQEAFPLSRPDLAKCRDPRGVSRCNIALLDVCTCLAIDIFIVASQLRSQDVRLTFCYLFLTILNFMPLLQELKVFILMTDFFNQSYTERLTNVN